MEQSKSDAGDGHKDADRLHSLVAESLGQTDGPRYGQPLPMAGGGSHRRFYRLHAADVKAATHTGGSGNSDHPGSLVGVVGEDSGEIAAYLAYTRHFTQAGIPVARVFGAAADNTAYLMEDLGEETLAHKLAQWKAPAAPNATDATGAPGAADATSTGTLALNALHRVVRWLAVIQVRGGRGLDTTLAADGASGGSAAGKRDSGLGGELGGAVFRADLQAFMEHYLAGIGSASSRAVGAEYALPSPPPLDAGARRELDTLIDRLDALPREYFCYRDFQARNIMWVDLVPGSDPGQPEGPVFLDYQSGRRGPLAYDLASLLYSPDTPVDDLERDLLIAAYLEALAEQGVRQPRDAFLEAFYPIVLIRRLQAMGAYARIGLAQGKPGYLEKIPPALATLRGLLEGERLNLGLPALESWLEGLTRPG